MLRTALTPRWLGLLAVALLFAAVCVQLGRWQLGVAHDRARVEAVQAAGRKPVVDLTTLLKPHEAFPPEAGGRLVTVQGRYADTQVLVQRRLLNGREGYWVITPFTVTVTGATLPLLRGWTPDPTLPPVPTGDLTITASLAPGESPSEAGLPEGRLSSVDLARLVNTWPGDIYNGFGFVQREQPTPAPDTRRHLTYVTPPVPDSGLQMRNAAYAVQWWVFAAFALYMWIRMVHQAAREQRSPTSRPRIPEKEAALP